MELTDKFTSYADKANGVLSWQIKGNLTVEDAQQAAANIRKSMGDLKSLGEVKLLVDNRHTVAFSPQVNEIWDQLQREIVPQIAKCAIICSGAIMKMQMDRIARSTGLEEVNKSFWDEDPNKMIQDAYEFLGVKENALVK